MYRLDFGYTYLNGYFIIEKVLNKVKRYSPFSIFT